MTPSSSTLVASHPFPLLPFRWLLRHAGAEGCVEEESGGGDMPHGCQGAWAAAVWCYFRVPRTAALPSWSGRPCCSCRIQKMGDVDRLSNGTQRVAPSHAPPSACPACGPSWSGHLHAPTDSSPPPAQPHSQLYALGVSQGHLTLTLTLQLIPYPDPYPYSNPLPAVRARCAQGTLQPYPVGRGEGLSAHTRVCWVLG